MKIRNGFVSNSSSSSFILVGVKLSIESLLNNPTYKAQFDQEMLKTQEELNNQWVKKMEHPNFEKFKTLYETCKENKVSIPTEVANFFGYRFIGVFEPMKANKEDILNEMVNEERFKFPKGIQVISDEDVTYLGKTLAHMNDDYLENGSISIQDMQKYAEILTNEGFDGKDIKIYYGTRAC